MSGLLNSLRKSRSIKQTLKMKLLTTISTSSEKKIFVFEGDEDFCMYETWILKESLHNNWVHVCGNGKEQLTSLYKDLMDNADKEVLPYCYFFIDHDYDITPINGKHILTLNCYSAENYIITNRAIESILKDEFKLNGEKLTIYNSYIKKYKDDFSHFSKLARVACKPLFVNHHTKGQVKHYKKISSLINIEVNNIKWSEDYLSHLLEYDEKSEYVNHFDSLSNELAIKGKYIYDFAKSWLASVKRELKKHYPTIKISKDPLQLELRRFASISLAPKELIVFLQKM